MRCDVCSLAWPASWSSLSRWPHLRRRRRMFLPQDHRAPEWVAARRHCIGPWHHVLCRLPRERRDLPGDFRTGEGAVFVPGQAGSIAVGMYVDPRSNSLFVSGGPQGRGGCTTPLPGPYSEPISSRPPDTFINDVVVTRQAAYFTDSRRALLYRVALTAGGALSDGPHAGIPLTGDFQLVGASTPMALRRPPMESGW